MRSNGDGSARPHHLLNKFSSGFEMTDNRKLLVSLPPDATGSSDSLDIA
jgi:hypothetical protein